MKQSSSRGLGWLYLIGGLIGLAAAGTLLVEKIALIADPEYIPTCSINPVLSCGSVMKTWQAAAFGIPNPILGIAGFSALAMLGAVLLARVELPRWIWIGAQVGVTFGIFFVTWLIYQSLYVIGALCPYCMVVWVVMIPVFIVTTLANLRRWMPRSRVVEVLSEYTGAIITAKYLGLIIIIAQRFWSYWSSLF